MESAASGASFRVGELARLTGKTVRTIHFYEELGLLKPAERTKGGFRLYGHEAVMRIQWVERLKELGFSLAEIKDFLENFRSQGNTPAAMASMREFYSQKIAETREGLRRLQALEKELQESLLWLDGCRSCEGSALDGHCPVCHGDHDGHTPSLVAAIRGSSASREPNTQQVEHDPENTDLP